MRTQEFINFVGKRAKSDTPFAFACRLGRFATIAPFMFERALRSKEIDENFGGCCVLKEIQGSKMFLDLEDKGLSHDLLLNNIREPYVTQAIQNEIHRGYTCVDIGANIGYYALQESRLVGNLGKVYAIEPVKESLDLLKRNIEVNHYKNIECYQLACGENNRQDVIHVSPKRNWSSMYPSNSRQFVRDDTIEVVTLDKFLENRQYPDFIRMDVEGYEYEIVKGMTLLLADKRPLKLFIEYHLDILRDKTVALAQILKEAGMEIKFASVEPHPAIANNKVGMGLIKLFEKGIGAQSGCVHLNIDDLIHNPIYRSGQVEYLEILFGRD